MKRTCTALGVAGMFAFACSLSAAAQSGTTASAQANTYGQHGNQVTMTGCVQQNKSGGHFLTHASVATTMASKNKGTSPTTTGTSGTTTPATTATGTSGTTPSPNATWNNQNKKTARNTWNLENGNDLDRYNGQQVRVTGVPKDSTSADQLKGSTSSKEIHARDFDVKSVQMISSTCPSGAGR